MYPAGTALAEAVTDALPEIYSLIQDPLYCRSGQLLTSMDHCDVSYQDGQPVSTRKGIGISKTKHLGTRFVNTYASSAAHTYPTSNSASLRERDEKNPPQSSDAPENHREDNSLDNSRFADDVTAEEFAVGTPLTTTATTPGSTKPTAGEDTGSFPVDHLPQPPTWPWGGSGDYLSNLDSSAYEHTQQLSNMSSSQQGSAARTQPSDKSEPAQVVQELVREYLVNVPTRSHTHDAIALVASLVNGGRGSGSPNELSESIARVCATINRDLLINDEDGRRTELAVIESIASMAMDAVYAGRRDHWHILMRGLRDIVDRGGGMKAEWAETLNRVRKYVVLFSHSSLSLLARC